MAENFLGCPFSFLSNQKKVYTCNLKLVSKRYFWNRFITIKNMAEIVQMPKMSDTMTEGVVAKWHKKIGDAVKNGEVIAEIETDKATMDYESFHSGTVLYLGAKQGEPIKVNEILAIVGKQGEDISSLLGQSKPAVAQVATSTPSTPAPAKPPGAKINAEIVRMPKMSDTMTDGVIAKWNRKVGDQVKTGEVLAEIETDKASMDYESYNTGTLLYIGANAKESVKVNGVLAIIGDKNADWKTLLEAETSATSAPSAAENSATPKTAPSQTPPAIKTSSDNGRVRISPLARKLALEKGIDISKIQGSGDGSRIIRRDVEQFQSKGGSASAATAVTGKESFTEAPLSQMRKTIARRLSESKFSAPHFYLTMEINMDNATVARKIMNESSAVKISFNDIIIKAAAAALRQHPDINVSWLGDKLRKNNHIHIGVAVAIPDGLVVPVLRFADQKSLSQIATEVKDLAQKAADKKLQPADWEGSTFTISNLGMFGIEEFTAIINPPDACILAIGGIKQAVIVKNNQPTVGYIMKATMSCDHRAVDGAAGAAFLKTLKNFLEEPVRILI